MRRVLLIGLYILIPNHVLFGECIVSETSNRSVKITLTNLKDSFSEAKVKLSQGLSVSLLSLVEWRTGAGDQEVISFGCKLRYDLWEEYYVIEDLKDIKSRTSKELVDVPGECIEFVIGKAKREFSLIRVKTILDPVSKMQMERTKDWLAKKGIASGSPFLVGRVVHAFIDFDREKSILNDCMR